MVVDYMIRHQTLTIPVKYNCFSIRTLETTDGVFITLAWCIRFSYRTRFKPTGTFLNMGKLLSDQKYKGLLAYLKI